MAGCASCGGTMQRKCWCCHGAGRVVIQVCGTCDDKGPCRDCNDTGLSIIKPVFVHLRPVHPLPRSFWRPCPVCVGGRLPCRVCNDG